MDRRRLISSTKNNRLYLYNRGDLCEEITGGWVEGGYVRNLAPIFAKRAGYLELYTERLTREATNGFYTVSHIDLSQYSKLVFIFEYTALMPANSEVLFIYTPDQIRNARSVLDAYGSRKKQTTITDIALTQREFPIAADEPVQVAANLDSWNSGGHPTFLKVYEIYAE